MILGSRFAFLLFWCSLISLTATTPAYCQTETVLHNFKNGKDGSFPYWGLTAGPTGNLYGTTQYGGANGYGVVFELSSKGNGVWTESVLHSFTGGKDGKNPSGPMMFDGEGNLYGTTQGGGERGYGVVFELKHVGNRWEEKVLHNFRGGSDGQFPIAGVIRDKAGNLYGTTYNGFNQATVFELSRSERGWVERVIYRVATSGAGLTMDASGNIFLATYWLVLKLSKDDEDHWTATVIHTFTGYPTDGYWASSRPVFDRAGNLYGATTAGGLGTGLVYKLIPGKDGTWTEKILHYFNGPDGNGPGGDILLDAAGNIYGTTDWGGEHAWGTVFELAPTPTGYQHKILWNFTGTDGLNPQGQVVLDYAGNLYGTASKGGTTYSDNYGFGVVFEIRP